jgi:cyclic pyranopterin phosphate synthase
MSSQEDLDINIDPLYYKRIEHAAKYIRKNRHIDFCPNPGQKIFIDNDNKIYSCEQKINYLGELTLNQSISSLLNSRIRKAFALEMLESPPLVCKKSLKCIDCNKNDEHLLLGLADSQNLSINYQDGFFENISNEDLLLFDSIRFSFNTYFNIDEFIKGLTRISIINNSIKLVFDFHIYNQFEFIFNNVIFSNLTIMQINLDLKNLNLENGHEDLNSQIQALKKEIKPKNTNQRFFVDISVKLIIDQFNWQDIPETFIILKKQNIKTEVLLDPNFLEECINNSNNSNIEKVFLNFLNLSSIHNFHFEKFYKAFGFIFKNSDSIKIKKFQNLFLLKLHQIRLIKDKICVQPFSQIAILPDGSINPCCWLGDYALKHHKFEAPNFLEIWNNAQAKNLRKEFLSGDVKICKKNMSELSCHVRDYLHQDLVEYEENMTSPILKLHWSFNGKCNLTCQTCLAWQHDKEFEGVDLYWNQLVKTIFPNICEVELVGGEPFYQKRTYDLINAVSSVNPNCVWRITSNGQINFEGAIKQAISKIRIGLFSISIDSLNPERFNKIRSPGVLEKTLTFLEQLIFYKKSLPINNQFEIRINFVLQKDNWFDLEEILLFAQRINVKLYIISMTNPWKFSIYDLPIDTRKKILLYVQDLSKNYNQENLHNIIVSLEKTVVEKCVLAD